MIVSMSGQRNHTVLKFNELVKTGQLGNLYQYAINISALNRKLHKYLGAPLNNHCQIANYSDQILIISTETAVWASKLRYCSAEILNYARNECGLVKLKKIQIKVVPCYP